MSSTLGTVLLVIVAIALFVLGIWCLYNGVVDVIYGDVLGAILAIIVGIVLVAGGLWVGSRAGF